MTVGILFIDHGSQCGELTSTGEDGESGAATYFLENASKTDDKQQS